MSKSERCRFVASATTTRAPETKVLNLLSNTTAADEDAWKTNTGHGGSKGDLTRPTSLPKPITMTMVIFALATLCDWRRGSGAGRSARWPFGR
jgi:hypothetical protein